jgi:hypothetical protein
MDPKAFIDLAQSLIDEYSPSEAAIRTSIGRSYYGLYNLLSEFHRSVGIPIPDTADAHTIVRRDLYECGIIDAKSIALFLDSLREERNKADYDLGLIGYTDKRTATMSLMRARTAYKDFRTLTASRDKRNHLKKQITSYRQSINS